jgi:hypothetical protein
MRIGQHVGDQLAPDSIAVQLQTERSGARREPECACTSPGPRTRRR